MDISSLSDPGLSDELSGLILGDNTGRIHASGSTSSESFSSGFNTMKDFQLYGNSEVLQGIQRQISSLHATIAQQ